MIELLPLPDIQDEPPAGPNLENDPSFREMNQAAKGKSESQFDEAATPPDWKLAATEATGLLERTRDLRVLVMLAIARLNLQDIPAFAGALLTIRQLVETMWDDIHPRLDPEDDNDPIMRANALADLGDGRVVRVMRDVAMVAPPRLRPIAWRDIAVMTGAMEAEPGRDKVTEAEVRASFAAMDRGRLTLLHESLDVIVAELAAIPRAFDEKAGVGQGPDFRDLPKLVFNMRAAFIRFEEMTAVSEEGGDSAAADEAGGDEGGEEPEGRAPKRAGGGRSYASIKAISGLDSRDDALHALSLASAYFRVNEPSSPLPLLIDRAARLAPMPFMDILRDLAPDGLAQAEVIVGRANEGSDDG